MDDKELKIIWKTLADEKLIKMELADENIERIIEKKNSNIIASLNKKLRFDYIKNISTVVFIIIATVFISIYNNMHQQVMPIESYLFLFLTLIFFVFLSLDIYSKIKLLKHSSEASTIKESLQNAKKAVEKTSKKGKILFYAFFIIIVIYGNVLLNEYTDFSNFNFNNLQGYVLIISIISLIIMPFTERIIFKKRFSGIINDIKDSLNELEEL